MRALPFALVILAATTLAGASTPPLDRDLVRYLPAPWGLSRAERTELSSGATIERPMAFERDGKSYVGGVAYQVVRASPERVREVLERVADWPSILPRTKRAKLVGRAGRAPLVEITQGNALVEATYTVRLEQSGATEIRFWLDPSRPHDVDDVWGFFRVTRFRDGSLVTFAAAVDVGPGLASLFESRVQAVILRAPAALRGFVEALPPG